MAELSKLGRYELRRVLGRGAMGVVYEGFDPTLSRRVAVKTVLKSVALDDETERAYSARFAQEAKAVARLNHPHIVQVHDFGVEGEVAYLVMEFIQGRELRSFFEAKEKFGPAETVRIMGELLDALDFAHEAGVIHRDVKPANVMLDAQRHVKLADFGVARIQDSAQRSGADTMVGTPAFMSPEQIQGLKIDRRTDVFSAGNILYQLLTGEQPFKGAGAWTVAKAIMQNDPPRPSAIVRNISPAFDVIVSKALAKNPAERYASAREFAVALRSAPGKVPAGVDPDATVVVGSSSTPPSAKDNKRSFAIAGIVTVVVVAGGAAAYVMLGRTPAPTVVQPPAPVAETPAPTKAATPAAPEKPQAAAIDEEKIRRETEERLRREFADKAAAEKVVVEKAAAEKAAAEKLASAKTVVEKEAAEKLAQKAAAERIAAEKAAADQAAASKAAADKAAADKLAVEKAASEKAAAEKAAAEKAAMEKAAAEKLAAVKTAAPAAKPGWPAVADRWVYAVRDSNVPDKEYEATVEVKGITSSSVRDVFSSENGVAIPISHESGARLIRVAPGIFSFLPYLGAFQELRVGDQWANIDYQGGGFCSAAVTCIRKARVVSRERVSVRAGVYNAWKIVVELRLRSASTAGEGELFYWYAEEAKRIVKYQARVRFMWWLDPNMDMELVSYTPGSAR